MEFFNAHQILLLISMFFFVSRLAAEPPISPVLSPNLQPGSSPDEETESFPTPSSLPPLNEVSFPPSGADAPSTSIYFPSLLVSKDGPEDSPDGPEDSPDGPEDSPDGPEDSPDGPVDSPDGSGAYPEPEGPDGEVPTSVQTTAESKTVADSEPTDQETTIANPEVKKVCGSTDYPILCIRTIDPLVSPKREVSLDTVLEVSIKATQNLAKAALVVARKLANAPGTSPEVASVLNDCKESYDDALYNFQNAMEAYATRDIGTMNTMLSAVITDIGDCNDEFSSLNIASPISDFAEKLINMTSNCLAIVSLLQN